MDFHLSGYDPAPRSTLVCRYQRWGLLFILAAFWGAAALWFYLDAPWFVSYGVTAIAALLTPPLLRSWRKRGRSDNWALALDARGVWLNLRDCEFYDAERGETIVHIPYEEIRAARRSIERYSLPEKRNDSSKHRDDFLELILVKPDAPQIAERIAADQRRESPPHKSFGGTVTTRVPRTIATVRTAGDDVVRILYSSRTHRLTPRMSKILAALEKHVPIERPSESSATPWQSLSTSEMEERVRALVAQGRIIDATTLVRQHQGLSLKEARQRVESLAGSASRT